MMKTQRSDTEEKKLLKKVKEKVLMKSSDKMYSIKHCYHIV